MPGRARAGQSLTGARIVQIIREVATMKLFGMSVLLLTSLMATTSSVPAQSPTKSDFEQSLKWMKEAAEWVELVCTPVSRHDCEASGCNRVAPSVKITLRRQTPTTGTISRCDSAGCDRMEAGFSTGGVFTSAQTIAPRGYIVKVLASHQFVEVATLGLAPQVSFGQCSRTR